MSIEFFQQVGHNQNWNVESFVAGCGKGLILSPVNQSPSAIAALDVKVRQASIFDPQFYLPNSQKQKLKEYKFFPDTLLGGFETVAYEDRAGQAAEMCVDYQLSMSFKKIVIPTRFYKEMYPDLTEYHNQFTVAPFSEVLKTKKDRPVVLSLVLTSAMIEHKGYRTTILNWVTSHPVVDEIYLVYCVERENKQISHAGTVLAMLEFVREIADTGLKLTIGYQNTESLLFSMIDGIVCTAGTFENTRIFSLDRFVVSEEDRRGPKPRIYLPGLLNWVQFDQAKQIRTKAPDLWKKIYLETEHSARVMESLVEPYFNQPGLYRHHLECMSLHFSMLDNMSLVDIKKNLADWIAYATAAHQTVRSSGIVLDPHGDGRHLPGWAAAVDGFVI